MEPKLRDYIENLFATAPNTKQSYELKEEIIRNTIERYHDLLADGKSEGGLITLQLRESATLTSFWRLSAEIRLKKTQ